ncbi:DUF4434 family protein [Pseudomonas sp. H9]|uniref:DUF4434 family protein n=1 Tax=Pseudomonas sp. H9 TaxID=483968 RepID=UPI0010576E8B|nr:DUF4434 family protein [Pseudomonas sp. H9]TDF84154.1 DUF4434 family protein [Pseudomonas sp. H9]
MRNWISLLLLALSLSATADQRVFYQPLNRDASLSPAQWQALWKATAAQGGKTLIVQWTAYGDSDFGGADGWLANSLRGAHEQGLQLVLGLYMDAAYYQRINELDSAGLATYWKAQLGRSLTQQQRLQRDWKLPVAGWYLPMELDDVHFNDQHRRQALYTQLQAFRQRLDAPVHVSAFSAAHLSPAANGAWLQQLAAVPLQVWWQDGAGTQRLSPWVRQQYLSALPCSVGVVQEAFRQSSRPGQPFTAVAATPEPHTGCHPTAVFSLRYRPWAKGLLTLDSN